MEIKEKEKKGKKKKKSWMLNWRDVGNMCRVITKGTPRGFKSRHIYKAVFWHVPLKWHEGRLFSGVCISHACSFLIIINNWSNIKKRLSQLHINKKKHVEKMKKPLEDN